MDRRQSSHAYSTALSTPPSQEGKNHPRVPDAPLRHPYPPLERKRRDEDEAIATARIDRWGRVGRKREIHGNWARDAARRGDAGVLLLPKEGSDRAEDGCSRDFLRISRRLLSTVEDNRGTTFNRFHEIVLGEIRQTSGNPEPRPIRRSSATSSFRDSRFAASSISPTDPSTFQRPAMPFASRRTSAKARS